MSPHPVVVGLVLCEKAIVEQGTNNISLVSTFTMLNVDGFPTFPQRFVFYTVLTGGLGDGTIDLVIRHLESNEEVYAARMPVHFPDRVANVRVLMRINQCVFPMVGEHVCTLLLDGEWLGQHRLTVVKRDQQ